MARPTTNLANTETESYVVGQAYDSSGEVTQNERTTNNRVVRYSVTCRSCAVSMTMTKLKLLTVIACPSCKEPWRTQINNKTMFVTQTRALVVEGSTLEALKTLPRFFILEWIRDGFMLFNPGSKEITSRLEVNFQLRELALQAMNKPVAEIQSTYAVPHIAIEPITASNTEANLIESSIAPYIPTPAELADFEGAYGDTLEPPADAPEGLFQPPEAKSWVLVPNRLYEAFRAVLSDPKKWAQLEADMGFLMPKNSKTSIATYLPEKWVYVYYPEPLKVDMDSMPE